MPNAFCVLKTSGQNIGKTPTIRKNMNPQWDCIMNFDLEGDILLEGFTFEVYDQKAHANMLGLCHIGLAEILENTLSTGTYKVCIPIASTTGIERSSFVAVREVLKQGIVEDLQESEIEKYLDSAFPQALNSGLIKLGFNIELTEEFSELVGQLRTKRISVLEELDKQNLKDLDDEISALHDAIGPINTLEFDKNRGLLGKKIPKSEKKRDWGCGCVDNDRSRDESGSSCSIF